MQPLPRFRSCRRFFSSAILLFVVIGPALFLESTAAADQVEMQNGDRYTGRVLSYTNNIIVLTNESIGTVSIPRTNVARVMIGPAAPNGSPAPAQTATPSLLPGLPSKSLAGAITNLDKSSTADQADKVKQQL